MTKLKTFFAIVLTVVTLTHSKPSQAAVGIFTGGATAILGLKVIAGGVVGGIAATYAFQASCRDQSECLNGIVGILLGATVVAFGVAILDGEQIVEFQELNTKRASLLGVTEIERDSFNSELDQANILLKEVSEKMASIEKPAPEDSVAAWNDVKDLVSPATFSAMQKIASQK